MNRTILAVFFALLGSTACFEEIHSRPLHPSAMMGSFVPARSSSSSPSPSIPDFVSLSSVGVPRVLHSEQAEKRYQQIMGRQHIQPQQQQQQQRQRPQARVRTRRLRPQQNSYRTIYQDDTVRSKGNNKRMMEEGMAHKDMMMKKGNFDEPVILLGMKPKLMRGGEAKKDAFRNRPYSVTSDAPKQIQTRNRRIRLGRGPNRLSESSMANVSKRPMARQNDVEDEDHMMPMMKMQYADEEMENLGDAIASTTPNPFVPPQTPTRQNFAPNNIQEIIGFQEDLDDADDDDMVIRREVLDLTVTSAEPIFQRQNSLPRSTTTTTRFGPTKKKAPKLVLLSSGGADHDPNILEIGGDDSGKRKSQTYEFKIEDDDDGAASASAGAGDEEFTTVEVEASVPLELSYVMELIREGFFEDEQGQPVFTTLDVA